MDMVTITCYGKTETMERQQAIESYTEAMLACKGAEKDHYDNILSQLQLGRKVCTDKHD